MCLHEWCSPLEVRSGLASPGHCPFSRDDARKSLLVTGSWRLRLIRTFALIVPITVMSLVMYFDRSDGLSEIESDLSQSDFENRVSGV